jgi:hypothetical protein
VCQLNYSTVKLPARKSVSSNDYSLRHFDFTDVPLIYLGPHTADRIIGEAK